MYIVSSVPEKVGNNNILPREDEGNYDISR